MLRASAATSNTSVNLQLVNGQVIDEESVSYANELTEYATAIASRDEEALTNSRNQLLTVSSPEVVVDAAAVAGNFQRMVRIADSIGIALEEDSLEQAGSAVQELNLRSFQSADHTPA